MKKISILFVAAVSLAAFGCKKKGGDCDKAINNMMEVSKADMSKNGMDDKMMGKMKDIAMQHCKDDKWPDDALKCMSDAKTSADANACQSKVPKEMADKMAKDMMAAMTAGGPPAPAGGSAEGSAAAPAGGSAEGSGGAAMAGGGDLPKECADYKAAIEKLASCDKMPQQARDALKQAYDQASAGWANLPAESKAGLATACKAGADAVMQSAKATCGW